MSEQRQPQPTDLITGVPSQQELAGVYLEEVELRGDSLELGTSNPYMKREEALKEYGINGDILGVIVLPDNGDERFPAKEVGIIDYGEVDSPEDAPYVMYDRDEAKPVDLFGRVQSRFALEGLNYTPADHLLTYYALQPGETVIGRQIGSHVNHMLGLSENARGNDYISRQHATISLDGDKVTVTDHSRNGTTVRYASY